MMLIGVIILLPWFFSVLQYKNEFRISTTDHFAGKIYYFPDTIDSLLAKFGFFYIDKRVNEDGLFSTPTPFLNAPLPLISIALSFFFFYCALTSEKLKLLKYLCPALFIIMILIIGIIPPDAGQVGLWTGTAYVSGDFSLIHRILSPIQFAYRLSGTISLCFVVMTIFSVHLFANTNPSDNFVNKLNKYIYYACFFAVLSNAQKVGEIHFEYFRGPELLLETSPVIPDDYIDAHVLLIETGEYQSIVKDTSRYPFTFYGSRAYTMPKFYLPRPEKADQNLQTIPVIVRDYAQDIHVTCERDCILQTNIVPTTLHRILIDGREPERAFLAKTENLDFELPAGAHVLRIDLVGRYVKPIIMSIWFALGLLCLVVVYAAVMIGAEIRARLIRLVDRDDCAT